jgi:glycine cleavage system H protein
MAETHFYKRATFVTHLPKGYLFSPSHYWLAPEEGGQWRVGFTKFATRMLGEMVDHQFEKGRGEAVASGEIVGSVEGFKAISDLYSPVRGHFVEGNPLLSADPEKIAQDPYGEGWLFRVTGEPDPRCGSFESYCALLDATIDRMLEKQASEGASGE